jgi:hypothetical protein
MAYNLSRRTFVADSFALTCAMALHRIGPSGLQNDMGSAKDRFYILDLGGPADGSTVLVYDAATLELTNTLTTRYHPDVCVSGDGNRIFICDSDLTRSCLGGVLASAELRIYDASTFDVIARAEVLDRPCYPVIPRLNGMVVAENGRYVYILQRWSSRKGIIATYDVEAAEFNPYCLKLPDSVASMAVIPRSQLLAVALQGPKTDDICIVDFGANDSRSMMRFAGFKASQTFEGRIAGVALDPSGAFIYAVTRSGHLRVVDAANAFTVSEVELDFPTAASIPPDHLFATQNQLLLGAATSKELATSGKADTVFIYDLPDMTPRGSFSLRMPSEQLVPSADGMRLYAASVFLDQSVTVYRNGRAEGVLTHAAPKLAHLALAPSPR